MSRLVIAILILIILWALLEIAARRLFPSGERRAGNRPEGGTRLVPCSRCGVHVAETRTLPGTGADRFCSEECRSESARLPPRPPD